MSNRNLFRNFRRIAFLAAFVSLYSCDDNIFGPDSREIAASGSQYWDIINTTRAQHIRVSNLQRESDPAYQAIQTEAAEMAWKNLNRHKRLW